MISLKLKDRVIKSFINKIKHIDRKLWINYLILLYAFLLSFPVSLKTPILILMIILWISDKKEKKPIPKEIKRVFFIMILLFIFILISTIYSNAKILDMAIYIKKLWYFLPIFIIYRYLKKEFIPLALTIFLIGMSISEILSYGVFFSFWQIRHATPSNPSIFLHHIQYSIFLSITAIILLFKILEEPKKRLKIVYTIFFTTVTLNLFINIGRTGYITFITGLFLSFLSIYKIKIKTIFLSLLLLFTVISFSYILSPNFKTRVLQARNDINMLVNKGNYDTSIGSRIALWIVAKEIFLENPIFGVGVANHLKKKNEYAKTHKEFKFLTKISHFHNSFLEIITQFGLIGLSLFIYLLYSIYKIPIKNIQIKVIKISLLSIFIIGSFSDRLFHLNSTMSLFSFLLGIILTQFRVEKEEFVT